jgi:hypothetical protein
MSENPANCERTRHVDTRVHYLREVVRDGHVKLLKCAGPQNVAEAMTKTFRVQPLPNIGNTCGAHVFLSHHFISLFRLDGPRRLPIISSHHADIKSHAPPEKYFLGGCTYVCVCMCVDMTYDATIDTGGERNRV